MSDADRFPSPDGRYYVLRGAYEVRMSHWIFPGALWDAQAERLLVPLGNSQWSAEVVEWVPDGSRVTVELRRYPGDAPSITLDLEPGRRIAAARPPADAAPVPFDALAAFLEDFYRGQRRRA
jgi:hypothetical protein